MNNGIGRKLKVFLEKVRLNDGKGQKQKVVIGGGRVVGGDRGKKEEKTYLCTYFYFLFR